MSCTERVTSPVLVSALLPSFSLQYPHEANLLRSDVFVIKLQLLLLLYFCNITTAVGFVVAERVLYLPSMGFTLLLSHFLTGGGGSGGGRERGGGGRGLAGWFGVGVIAVMCVCGVTAARARNEAWNEPLRLWLSAVEVVCIYMYTHANTHKTYITLTYMCAYISHIHMCVKLLK